MDFIEFDKKLIQEELRIRKTIEEFSKTNETIVTELKSIEEMSISDLLKLPLKIYGKMIGIGLYHDKYYTEESLKWSVQYHINKPFPIRIIHKGLAGLDTDQAKKILNVGNIIGRVDSIYWDDITKTVMYEGHINDETQARNVKDGLLTEVSATIASFDRQDNQYGHIGIEPEFIDLSIVHQGAYSGNSINVKE